MSDVVTELKRLRDALSASGDVAYEWDLGRDSLTWLNGAHVANGLTPLYAAASRDTYEELIVPEDRAYRQEALDKLSVSAREFESEYRMQFGDGEPRWFHDRGVAEYSPTGEMVRLRGILRPLTAKQMTGARLDYVANHDALTGLYNRARLCEALDQSLYSSQRYNTTGAYLAIAIDQLVMVNQAFGHEVADTAVVTIADRLDRCLRTSDVVGRIGGAGFGVVLANCPEADINNAVEKILYTVRNTGIDTPTGPIHVTVSIGVVTFPGPLGTAADVMTKADIALQTAQQSGRDCFTAYNCSDDDLVDHREHMVIAERVQKALRENRLTIAYQPVVDSATRSHVHYECLLRMVEPDGEVVPASRFMPIVENLGMIRPVDRLVLELAVERLTNHPTTKLAINVSGLTTRDASWLRTMTALLRGKPEISSRLLIEITETAGLEDIDACSRFVSTLRDFGCVVALDDFGAGYTSFRHLKQLPVNMVKIDGSFVRNIGDNPDNLLFVRTLIDLASNFDLLTVAECVETEAEAELLANEGVNYLQGYLFGAPSLQEPWSTTAKIAANIRPAARPSAKQPAAAGR